MSTINTMEDLIQVLDEHPEWLEALRARLLTRELLDLPHNFAMFVAEMREFKSEMREFQSEMREFKRASSRRRWTVSWQPRINVSMLSRSG